MITDTGIVYCFSKISLLYYLKGAFSSLHILRFITAHYVFKGITEALHHYTLNCHSLIEQIYILMLLFAQAGHTHLLYSTVNKCASRIYTFNAALFIDRWSQS
jgi:hypothetical protein